MRSFCNVILSVSFLLLTACDQKSDEALRNIQGGLEKGLESAQKTIESLGPEKSETTAAAVDEVEKLFRFEYQVFRIRRDAGDDMMSFELNKLGEERWDCFHVIDHQTELELFCKRRPKSYLRYFKAL